MPPVKEAKKHEPRVLERDVALQGFLDPQVKVIFMDATSGFTDKVTRTEFHWKGVNFCCTGAINRCS